MHPHMYTIAQDLGNCADDLIAIPEFAGPFGIADLAVLATTRDKLVSRLTARIEPLVHELDAAIVAHLTPRRGRLISEVAQLLAVREAALERRISHLKRIGAIEQSSSGRLTRHEALVPLGRIYSIESKVNAWRRALDQARTYALWSDRSIAVLGSLPADRGVPVRAARSSGVGLALGSRWLVRPRAIRHSPARRLWTSEIFLAALMQPES